MIKLMSENERQYKGKWKKGMNLQMFPEQRERNWNFTDESNMQTEVTENWAP